jgi:hypothetical protein
MQYKISKQHSNGIEILIARCENKNDAELLINKLQEESANRKDKSNYRLIDHETFYLSLIEDPFRIIIREPNQQIILAEFRNLNDAKIFVRAKLAADLENHTNINYYIFDRNQFLELHNHTTGNLGSTNKSNIIFRPTPLATTPRLGPAHWLIDDEDEGKGNKGKN